MRWPPVVPVSGEHCASISATSGEVLDLASIGDRSEHGACYMVQGAPCLSIWLSLVSSICTYSRFLWNHVQVDSLRSMMHWWAPQQQVVYVELYS